MKRWWQELNPVRQSQETLNRPVHKIIIQEAKQEFTRVYNWQCFSDQADTERIFELQILNKNIRAQFYLPQSDDRIKLGTARWEALMLPLSYIIPHLLFKSYLLSNYYFLFTKYIIFLVIKNNLNE